MVVRWICNPEVPGSNPPPCHWIDLSSVVPNSAPPRLVNSQQVSLPPVGILNLSCLICIIFVCYAQLNIFTWNLRDINVFILCSFILKHLQGLCPLLVLHYILSSVTYSGKLLHQLSTKVKVKQFYKLGAKS